MGRRRLGKGPGEHQPAVVCSRACCARASTNGQQEHAQASYGSEAESQRPCQLSKDTPTSHMSTATSHGALEHILEAPGLRPFFEHWVHDPDLRKAHESALEWGLAHADRDAV
jgi:hypothetical protein